MKGFGERLKKKREDKGFSQKQLAVFLGKKAAKSISDWEVDRQTPPLPVVADIAKILSTTTDFLILGIEEVDTKSLVRENELMREALNAYRRADKAEAEIIEIKSPIKVPQEYEVLAQ